MPKNKRVPPEPLQHMAPITDDLLRLRDAISLTLAGTLPKGWKISDFFKSLQRTEELRPLLFSPDQRGLDVSPGIEILIVGCFRANVWIEFDEFDEIRYVGWFYDPITLWSERHMDLLDRLRAIFDQLAKKSGHAFVRLPLANEVQIINWGEKTRGELPAPEIIYDVIGGEKFRATAEKPSHGWDGRRLIPLHESPLPQGYRGFTQVDRE